MTLHSDGQRRRHPIQRRKVASALPLAVTLVQEPPMLLDDISEGLRGLCIPHHSRRPDTLLVCITRYYMFIRLITTSLLFIIN